MGVGATNLGGRGGDAQAPLCRAKFDSGQLVGRERTNFSRCAYSAARPRLRVGPGSKPLSGRPGMEKTTHTEAEASFTAE